MARKVAREPEAGGKGSSSPGLLRQVYPAIERWASGYGWVEFGIDGLDRPFVRALDEGGTVWEGEARYGSLDEALGDLEAGLAQFMEEQGFSRKTEAKKATPHPRKAAR